MRLPPPMHISHGQICVPVVCIGFRVAWRVRNVAEMHDIPRRALYVAPRLAALPCARCEALRTCWSASDPRQGRESAPRPGSVCTGCASRLAGPGVLPPAFRALLFRPVCALPVRPATSGSHVVTLTSLYNQFPALPYACASSGLPSAPSHDVSAPRTTASSPWL